MSISIYACESVRRGVKAWQRNLVRQSEQSHTENYTLSIIHTHRNIVLESNLILSIFFFASSLPPLFSLIIRINLPRSHRLQACS